MAIKVTEVKGKVLLCLACAAAIWVKASLEIFLVDFSFLVMVKDVDLWLLVYVCVKSKRGFPENGCVLGGVVGFSCLRE